MSRSWNLNPRVIEGLKTLDFFVPSAEHTSRGNSTTIIHLSFFFTMQILAELSNIPFKGMPVNRVPQAFSSWLFILMKETTRTSETSVCDS